MNFMRFCAAVLIMTTSLFSSVQGYQIVLDGEDSAYRTNSPAWTLDKTGSFLGNYKFSVAGPGTGSKTCTWDIDAIPAGIYTIEFYVDNGNFAGNAQYVVEDNSGISTVTASQNFVGTGWRTLGTFNFNQAGRVTQTDYWTGGGTHAIADALRLTLQGTPSLPDPATSIPPEVSLVIDDLGNLNPNNSSTFSYQLIEHPADFSFAVIPGLSFSNAVLVKNNLKNKQSILHQPMQYIGQPDSNPADPVRLYISMNNAQILNVLNTNISSQLPYIWGINNHQGSRFSQHRPGLETALQDLKSRNMFFLDSRTVSDSVSYDIGREKGLLIAERDLFVDGNTVAHTVELIESVAQRAIYAPNFNHIMICHERPNTVPGIMQAMDSLAAMGVAVKRIDRNIHYIVETDKVPPGASVEVSGPWASTSQDMISHECYDGNALRLDNSTSGSVTFRPMLSREGQYRVFVNNEFRRATITAKNGIESKSIPTPSTPHNWVYLGTYPFRAGTAGSVTVHTDLNATGATTADAVKFTYDAPLADAGVENWKAYRW